MKKKGMQLAVLCAVLVVCLILFFVLRASNEKREEEEALAAASAGYAVTSLDPSFLTGMTIDNGKGELVLTREGEAWKAQGSSDVELDQDKVSELADKLCSLEGVDQIQSVTDFEQYGLTEPGISASLKTADGETVLCVGDTNEAVHRVYVYVKGTDTVYTAETSLETDLDVALSDLEKKEETDTDTSGTEAAPETDTDTSGTEAAPETATDASGAEASVAQ